MGKSIICMGIIPERQTGVRCGQNSMCQARLRLAAKESATVARSPNLGRRKDLRRGGRLVPGNHTIHCELRTALFSRPSPAPQNTRPLSRAQGRRATSAQHLPPRPEPFTMALPLAMDNALYVLAPSCPSTTFLLRPPLHPSWYLETLTPAAATMLPTTR